MDSLRAGEPFSVYNGAPFAAQEINTSLGAVPGNLAYMPNSGDYNADGNNNDFPNVVSYKMAHSRSSYLKRTNNGLFAGCVGANNVLPCSNFALPAFGQEGDEFPNQFRNPGFASTDITLKKITALTERVQLELRLDTFNVFNRVNLAGVDTNLQDSTFGQSTSVGSNVPRNMQVSGKLTF